MKTCRVCGKSLDETMFYRVHIKKPYPGFYYRTECKKCFNKRCWDNERVRNGLPSMLVAIKKPTLNNKFRDKIDAVNKLGGECSICGYKKCLSALEFHHMNPSTKEFGLANARSNKKHFENFDNELEKCILLCANCHREFHFPNKLPATSSYNSTK